MDQAEREFRELEARIRPESELTPEERARWRELLASRIRDGGETGRDALWLLLAETLDDLVQFLAYRVGDRELAADLAQDVVTAVVHAYRKGGGLRLEYGKNSFYKYLYTAAGRTARRHRSRSWDIPEVLTAPDELPPLAAGMDCTPIRPEFPAGTNEVWNLIEQAAHHLPAQVRHLAFLDELSKFGDLSDAELGRVLGLREGTNISQEKKRARKKFLDWFGVLWVARTMRAATPEAVPGCTVLDRQLKTWNPKDKSSFTTAVFSLVRGHIRGCETCGLVFLDFIGTGDGLGNTSPSSRLLSKFRALPAAAAPEALREWLESRRAEKEDDRRRTLIEILLAWRPDSSSARGAALLPASISRITRSIALRAHTATAAIARQPGVANTLEAVRSHPELARAVTVIVLVLAGAGAVVAWQPAPPPASALGSPPAATGPTPTAISASPTPIPSAISISSPTASPQPPAEDPASPTARPAMPQITLPDCSPSNGCTTSDRALEAGNLINQGMALWNAGQRTQAFAKYGEALQIMRALMAGDLTTYAPWFLYWAHYPVGTQLLANGQYPKAIALSQEAIDIARRFGDRYHIAAALLAHGNYVWTGGGDRARVFADYDESLSIMRTLVADDFTTYAATFVNWIHSPVGAQLLADGQYAKVLALGQEALDTARRLGDQRLLASTLLTHGNYVWTGGGDRHRVFADYDESLSIMRTLMADDFTNQAALFINWIQWPVAAQLFTDGQYAKAITLTEEAIATARRLGDRYLIAATLLNHGIYLWTSGGNHTQAFADYDESLSLLRTLMAGDFTTYASLFVKWVGSPIGPQLRADGQTDKATALTAEAETYRRQLGMS